jgi:hypothetical protein
MIGTIKSTDREGVYAFEIKTFNWKLKGSIGPNPDYRDDGRMKQTHIGKVRAPHGDIVEVMGVAQRSIKAQTSQFFGVDCFGLWFTDPDFPSWQMSAFPRADQDGVIYWEIQKDSERKRGEGSAAAGPDAPPVDDEIPF